jgi:hemerythrin-like domain-containing protein
MAESMTMNRLIHAAVRRDLSRLDVALGEARDGDRERARGLERAYANLRTQLTHHHEGEDAHIWPMLAQAGVARDLLATMESEHHAMADSLVATSTAMTTYAASGSAPDAAAARASLARTREVTERHLAHEENELEPQLRPHLETPEWKAVEKKLSRQPPGIAGRFFAWLTDGMSDEGRAYLRTEVPTPVVFVLSRVFGRQYLREVAPVWRDASARRYS